MASFPTVPLPNALVPNAESRAKLDAEPTVTMLFPRDVALTLVHGHTVHFKKGFQQVPASLAGDEQGVGMHWFLAGHGVRRSNFPGQVDKPVEVNDKPAVTEVKAPLIPEKGNTEEEESADSGDAGEEGKTPAEGEQPVKAKRTRTPKE